MTSTLLRTIIGDHRNALRATPVQHAHLRHLARCRTAAAGYHVRACTDCGQREVRANSCRNRHCPLCQGAGRVAWVQAREAELLPVPYLHVVCTLPHDLLPLVRHDPRLLYGLLMRCASQAIADLCKDPRHLGAAVGQVQVLHTWGSDLKLHPHVHSVVTGGGLDDRGGWVDCRINRKNKRPFLVPIRCLRSRFRGLMIRALTAAYLDGHFAGCDHPGLSSAAAWRGWLRHIGRKDWVVYAKRPFGSPAQVIRYLGRYTHRVALDPRRLSDYDQNDVTLTWTDYRHGGRQRTTRLSAQALLGRFVQHLLPKHFRRIRLTGIWGPRVRGRNLALARRALAHRLRKRSTDPCQPADHRPAKAGDPPTESADRERQTCPHCGRPTLMTTLVRRPIRGGGLTTLIPAAYRRWIEQRRTEPIAG